MTIHQIFEQLYGIFKKHGYRLFLVGGASRDYLLNKATKDFDFVTNAKVEGMKTFLTNIEYSFPELGSVSFKMGENKIDITTLRKEEDYQDFRHPHRIVFIDDLKTDSLRRDFTINAIYLDYKFNVYDYHQGREDLENHLLRAIGDPNVRINEDPLRIIRAIRFAFIHDFKIEKTLEKAIKLNLGLLSKIPLAKYQAELKKMYAYDKDKAILMLKKYQIDKYLPMEIEPMKLRTCDLHCDTITRICDTGKSLMQNDEHIDLNKLIKGEYLLQCFAVFVQGQSEQLFQKAKHYIDFYDQEMEKYPNIIKPVSSFAQMEENAKKGIISSLLTIEEGGAIEGSIEKLEYLYSRGVRMMTLTWNYPNQIGYPNFVFNPDKIDFQTPNTSDGLTLFGIEVVKKMNELGMIIDVSHLSDKGFYDCIKYSTQPIIASHSNARGCRNVVRNLTDEMILKIKEVGGVIGINYCPFFLAEDENGDMLKEIVKHINYIYDLAGIEVIALGSDFDGIPTPNGFESAAVLNKLYLALKAEKYSKKEIKAIFFENFLRVFKKVVG